MPIVALLAVVAALALQLASAAAPARDELVASIARRAVCVNVELGVRIAALCPPRDELAFLDSWARELRRAAAASSGTGRLWQGDLDHFEAFCARVLILDNGRPFVLEPFQRTMLADFFGEAVETLIVIPKKNGKTTLMAALLVYHLCYVDNAEAFLAASSIKQAGICYGMAAGYVKRSPALQARILVRAGTKELRSRRDDGTAVVLAADADTADGVGPTLAIVDELHRAKSSALFDVFRDGLDARDGAMLAITTAGDDEDSPLGQMRSNYLAMTGKRVRGRYTYCRSRDRTNVMHEWSLTAKDDLEDLELVKQVNPLRSMTIQKLRRRRESPSMTAHAWARFACNVWTQGDDAAVSMLDWGKRAREGLLLPAGSDVVIGCDYGWTQDETGLTPVGHPLLERDGELELDRGEAWIDARLVRIPAGTQQGPGVPLPDEDLERLRELVGEVKAVELAELAATRPGKIEEGRYTDEDLVKGAMIRLWLIWPDCAFAADPNAGGMSMLQWAERELCAGDETRAIVLSQQPAPMQAASMHFAAGIRTKVAQEPAEDAEGEDDVRTVPIFHPDDEGLNAHLRAAAARYNGERWRFDKRRKPKSGSSNVQPRPIDLVIASTLGYRALMAGREEPLVPFVMVARR